MDFCKQRCCRFCEYRKGIITILCNIVNSSEADRVLILPIKIKWNLKLFRRRMGFKKTSNWNNASSTHGAEFINEVIKKFFRLCVQSSAKLNGILIILNVPGS